MSAIHDGGPAFPCDSREARQFAGMSLRAYLAAKCPLTMEQSAAIYGMPLVEIQYSSEHAKAFWRVDASMRVEWADAMIAELSEPPPST